MKLLINILIISSLLMSCKSGRRTDDKASGTIRKVKVLEVIDSGDYTYLKADENGKELWLAINKMAVNIHETLYFEGGITMTDFKSETLNRTFESILFLDKINRDIDDYESGKRTDKADNYMAQHHAASLNMKKQDIKVDPVEGGITIAELYANKENYNGKVVKVRGQVIKFNGNIMNANWIHIQDGTSHEEDYDLTANSQHIVKTGDVVILEGKITLDKDLGHGYQYKILMENAEIK